MYKEDHIPPTPEERLNAARNLELVIIITKRITDHIEQGGMIWDGHVFIDSLDKIKNTGFEDSQGLTIANCVYYDHNEHFDNGFYTPTDTLVKELGRLKMIKPEDMKSVCD